jgi:hypothetical protein
MQEDSEGVEYIGMGPASCDCHTLLETTPPGTTCQCYETAKQLAQEHDLLEWNPSCTFPRTFGHKDTVRSFHMPVFNDTSTREKIIQQAQILVQYSKDTFWIDKEEAASSESLSILENLAYQLLLFHEKNDETCYLGAEWWVQVKEGQASTIEMHYDKDEGLAEAFGLGVFPTYSTVSYLTSGNAPTLIFPRSYHEPTESALTHVHVSHPLVGKHLVFDGSLLHGVIPSTEPPLTNIDQSLLNNNENKGMQSSILRVTFLVNLWKDHQPMGVRVLPQHYRLRLDLTTSQTPLKLVLREKPIPDILAHSTEYKSLPFIEDGLVVKSVVLPTNLENDDLACVLFMIGQEAYIDYPDSEDDESVDQ